jgi:hypothetical protein
LAADGCRGVGIVAEIGRLQDRGFEASCLIETPERSVETMQDRARFKSFKPFNRCAPFKTLAG